MIRLAWRNIWRNQRRSLITILSIGSGFSAIMFGQSMIHSVQIQLVEKSTGILTGHIRVMNKNCKDLKIPDEDIENPQPIEKALEKISGIQVFGQRILFTGLVSSPIMSKGVLVCAVQPEKESKIIKIPQYITQGRFLTGSAREIVLGDKLAEELEIRLGEKVVLLSQSRDGSMAAEAFRLAGVYHTGSTSFDGQIIYVPLIPCQEMLAMNGKVNDFVIRVKGLDQIDKVSHEIAHVLEPYPEVKTYTWKDVDRELVGIQKFQNGILIVVLVIIFGIVTLGIVNTLLMSLFERIREFGVLMAIGAKPKVILKLVLMESTLLGILGLMFGLSLGSLLIAYFGRYGLPLPIGEALSYFIPFDSVIYLRFSWDRHWIAIIGVFLTSFISGAIPALRASRLIVAKALRHV